MEKYKLAENINFKKPVKGCIDCKVIMNKDNFYKAGSNYYQSRCKPCHNAYRNTCAFITKTPYIKKGTGFSRLSPDVKRKL